MPQIDYSRVIENDEELELYQALSIEMLQFLANNGCATFGEIIRYVGGSDRRMLRLLDEMVRNRKVIFKDGRFYPVETQLPKVRQLDLLCSNCHGVIVSPKKLGDQVIDLMRDIHKSRPKPTFLFDQRPVTLDTTLRRAAYIVWRGDIYNRDIAVIGDDDLTSVAIALTGLTKSITVFDIDKRLIHYIRVVAEQHGLNLNCINLDVTQGVPNEFRSAFDVFVTDPTPTRIPFIVFVNAGIKLLRKARGVGYLSFYSSAMKLSIDLQMALSEMRLIITDLIPYFTEYDFVRETYSQNDLGLLEEYVGGVGDICFHECLCRVLTTTGTRTISLNYKLSDMIGKATRRTLADISTDPAMTDERDQEYLKQTALSLSQNQDKWLQTGNEHDP